MSTYEEIGQAMRGLAEMGYIETTGEMGPGPDGQPQPVYQISRLGHIAGHYLRQGLTFEAAMAKAKERN